MFRTPPPVRARRRRAYLSIEPLESRRLLDNGVRFAAGIGVTIPPEVPEAGRTYALEAGAVAVDASDNVYVAGSWFHTLQFGVGPAARTIANPYGPSGNGFLAKYAPDGTLLWTRSFDITGGLGRLSGDASVKALAVDRSGNLYAAGKYSGTVDFDSGPAVAVLDSAGMFLLRMTTDGDVVWAHELGEYGSIGDITVFDEPTGLALDDAGRLHVAGRFQGQALDFDPGPGEARLASGSGFGDAFVAQYDADGRLNWARALVGSSTSGATTADSFAVLPGGGSVVAGRFEGTTVFGPGATLAGAAGTPEAYVARLDVDGGVTWVREFRGTSGIPGATISADGLAADPAGNVFVAGSFRSIVDFDPGPGVVQLGSPNPAGGRAFLVSLTPSGTLAWARDFLAPDGAGMKLAVDGQGRPLLAGDWRGPVPLNPALPEILGLSPPPDYPVLVRFNAAGHAEAARALTTPIATVAGLVRAPDGRLAITGKYFDPVNFGGTVLPVISYTRPSTSFAGANGFVALLDPVTDPPSSVAFALSPASDTGDSHTDGLTAATTLVFDVNGVAPGLRVELYQSQSSDGDLSGFFSRTPVGTRQGPGQVAAPSPSTPPGVGTFYYWARVVDPDRGASAMTGPVVVAWDTLPPTKPQAPIQFFAPGQDAVTLRAGTVLESFVGEAGLTAELIDAADRVLATGPVVEDSSLVAGQRVYRITLPSGPTGTQSLRVRLRDAAGNVSPASDPTRVNIVGGSTTGPGGPSIPGTNGPRVLGARIVKTKKARAIVLSFDADLDPTRAASAAGYTLRGAGRDRRHGTRDDAKLRIKSAVYDPTSRTVTLTPSKALPAGQPLRLTITTLPGGVYVADLGPRPRS